VYHPNQHQGEEVNDNLKPLQATRPEQKTEITRVSKHVKGRATYQNSPVWTAPSKKELNAHVIALKLQGQTPRQISKATRLDPAAIEKIWARFKRTYMKAVSQETPPLPDLDTIIPDTIQPDSMLHRSPPPSDSAPLAIEDII
jgi:hypothetical protein